MYTVGRLAKRFGLSRSTLLYYDSIGLLKPSSHAPGEYRGYSEEDAERLELICVYRKAGMPLRQIGRILDSEHGDAGAVLEERLRDIAEEMDALREQQRVIAGLLGRETELGRAPMDKKTWVHMLRTAGFSDSDMDRWHRDFERMDPDKHEKFLRFLNIPENEIADIRRFAAAPHIMLNIQQESERYMEIFFQIYSELERKGPGSRAATAKALALCKGLPSTPRAMDIGCGSGLSTMDMAELSGAMVTAVDLSPDYVEETRIRAEKQGLSDRVTACVGDMAALQFENESFDLLWSEGAAYIMGFDYALEQWKRLLRPGGFLVVSEAVWLKPATDAPEELVAFWNEAYPAMRPVQENIQPAKKAGYEVLDSFTLEERAWDEFYDALENHLANIEPCFGDNRDGRMIIDLTRREIEIWRKYPGWYGYQFYVMKKKMK